MTSTAKETEKLLQLFNQSFKVKITALVFWPRGSTHACIHTHTHTFADESDFKKPGRCAPGSKTDSMIMVVIPWTLSS